MLVLGSSESACEPFKSEVFSLQFYSFTGCFLTCFSKPAVWGFVSPMQGLGVGVADVGLKSLTQRKFIPL